MMIRQFHFKHKDVPLQEYLNKMSTLLKRLLDYIEQDIIEENYQNLILFINDQKICEDPHLLKSFLHILSKIIDDHKRSPTFFLMIEKILLYLKGDIRKNFSNLDILNIFYFNKRIILFLIKEEFLFVNQKIYSKLKNDEQLKKYRYIEYFIPELKIYFDNEMLNQIPEIPPDFDDLRMIGENDSKICQLIRKDNVKNFDIYVKKNDINLNSLVNESIYETNKFLIENRPTIIEYAAFFGSIKIFNYLIARSIQFTSKLWKFAVHGRRKRIINHIESVNIKPSDESVIIESIKCHHNEITDYLNQQYMNSDNKKTATFCYYGLQFYDFNLIDINLIDASFFPFACKYDYFYIAEYLLKCKNVNVNAMEILQKIFLYL